MTREFLSFQKTPRTGAISNRKQTIAKGESNRKRSLLHDVAGADVARVKRLATGKSFVLPVIKTDAVLAQLPAEINIFVVNHGGKIEQPYIEIFNHAARLKDAVQR